MFTNSIFINCGLQFTFGMLIQVAMKIGKLRKRSKATNYAGFSIGGYFKDDAPALFITFFSGLAAMGMLTEFTSLKYATPLVLMVFFLTLGYTGSSIIQSFFSVTEGKILKMMDRKSDIADGKIPQDDE